MNDLETITIGEFCICCMETPGHTSDHCSFIVTHVAPESTKIPFLFCGDTMFVSGCGRVNDSTAEDLFYSFNKLMSLPSETLMFCGHEYTLNNLKFAQKVEPENKHIEEKMYLCQRLREAGEFTVG
jgi:hydroxyacylglutathione hydrolase